MTMRNTLHSRYDTDILYVSKKEKGRGLASIEDYVDTLIKRFEKYTNKSEKIYERITGARPEEQTYC